MSSVWNPENPEELNPLELKHYLSNVHYFTDWLQNYMKMTDSGRIKLIAIIDELIKKGYIIKQFIKVTDHTWGIFDELEHHLTIKGMWKLYSIKAMASTF